MIAISIIIILLDLQKWRIEHIQQSSIKTIEIVSDLEHCGQEMHQYVFL